MKDRSKLYIFFLFCICVFFNNTPNNFGMVIIKYIMIAISICCFIGLILNLYNSEESVEEQEELQENEKILNIIPEKKRSNRICYILYFFLITLGTVGIVISVIVYNLSWKSFIFGGFLSDIMFSASLITYRLLKIIKLFSENEREIT